MRNDYLALCLWADDVWGGIYRKPWVQRTTNRKWPIPSRIITWPMTSRDPEGSRSWPWYFWCPLSRNWLEIATWWQWSAYRKWPPGNQMANISKTAGDSLRSNGWPITSLRGSASPVLTTTHHSYGSPRLSAFFRLTPRGQTPQPIFTQNGSNDVVSRKDDTFAVKIATFHTPDLQGP